VQIEEFCSELDGGLSTSESWDDKVAIVERMLCKLSASPFQCCGQWDCSSDCYARHLVYQGEQSGCCIVAMSWGPGQGTPVHDHDGTWCVECCLEGRLEVVQYELEETREQQDDPVYVFERKESQHVGRGAVGCLIPPYEHHTIRNPFTERAVTLHVYGKELQKSSCFYPVEGNSYKRVERQLGYSNTPALN
jgi:predicted metal-dependent enzyme (double-stranded beta helix superfamily)